MFVVPDNGNVMPRKSVTPSDLTHTSEELKHNLALQYQLLLL